MTREIAHGQSFRFDTTVLESHEEVHDRKDSMRYYRICPELNQVFFCPYCSAGIGTITLSLGRHLNGGLRALTHFAVCGHCPDGPRVLEQIAMKNNDVHPCVIWSERLRDTFLCIACHNVKRTLLIAGIPSNRSTTGFIADLRYNCAPCRAPYDEVAVRTRPRQPAESRSGSELFNLGQQLLLSST